MKILAIETSCDETAVSLLEIDGELEAPDIKILGNTLLSQMSLHAKYGGVFPNLAKREHQKNLPILLKQTLEEAGMSDAKRWTSGNDIDCIAVTSGPGLEPALWVGINFAENLGKEWGKPVIPVNHMEGHIFSVLFGLSNTERLTLPALALLVSGGHTELVQVKDFGNYEILGQTRDDAVGEAFDKVARMLGLPYPGGPEISKLTEHSREKQQTTTFSFPRPMIHSKNLDFSFSGLKTAVLYKIREENKTDDEFKESMARAFEDAAVEVLVEKTRKALMGLSSSVKTLIVAGGVSANLHLSRELAKLKDQFPELLLRIPTNLLTTDNAIMIAVAAFININKQPQILENQATIRANGNLSL